MVESVHIRSRAQPYNPVFVQRASPIIFLEILACVTASHVASLRKSAVVRVKINHR